MPPVGRRCRKNECQADFHRPRHDVKFGNNVWDGENQRDIGFFSYQTPTADIAHCYLASLQTGRAILGTNSCQNNFFRQKSVCAHLH